MTLKKDEFYDIKVIGAGRKLKTCAHCGGNIQIGESHHVQYFVPDPNFVPNPNIPPSDKPGIAYRSYPTHTECSEPFQNNLI